MQASPSETSVTVLVDSTTVSTNLAYGANTGYLSVNSGSRNVELEPTGSTTPVFQQSVSVSSGAQMTVVTDGIAPGIAALILTDNTTAPAANTAQVRIVNAAPSMAAADIYVIVPGTSLSGVAPTVAGLSFNAVSAYQVLNIPTSGTTSDFEVFFTEPGTKVALLDTGALTFAAGQNRTLVALNSLPGQPEQFTSIVLADLN